MILMCKNVPVFGIGNETVLCPELLPGLMQKSANKISFIDWMEKRYSEKSNTYARRLRGFIFGQGNRQKINESTHAFSLSDCYWIKYEQDTATFENLSPYFNDFWKGEGEYAGQTIPTLYVNGYIPKYWLDSRFLIKAKEKHEILCANVANALGIPAAKVTDYEEGIAVENFTNENVMFESAEASGMINPDEFTVEDILRLFGAHGFDMLFIDALAGNGDRHAGNFGYLRDSNTGEYLGMAPLFDFDHAFESHNNNDILIREVRDNRKHYPDRFQTLVNSAKTLGLNEYMAARLHAMLA